MQDLVRVGVADAAERARIGERALEGVILRHVSRARNSSKRRIEHFEAAGIVPGELLRLRKHESEARRLVPASVSVKVPVSKTKEASAARFAALRPGGEPMQPPGDHQVQHQPVIALEPERDALAHAPNDDDAAAVQGIERRIERAQQERMGDPRRLEPRPAGAARALRCRP